MIKRFLLLFTAVSFLSCAHIQNIILAFSVAIDIQKQSKYSQYEIDQLYDYCVNKFGQHQYDFVGWRIYFQDDWIKQKISENEVAIADGLTSYKYYAIFVKVHDCLWDNSLFHEMAHVVQVKRDLFHDYDHKDKKWWDWVREQEKEMLSKCPKDYKRKGFNK